MTSFHHIKLDSSTRFTFVYRGLTRLSDYC
jgi:hypothetical protein